MTPIVLFEDEGFADLLPLLYWRSVFELFVGRAIILDRVAERFQCPVSGIWTRDWIARVAAQRCGAPANAPLSGPTILLNGRWQADVDGDIPQEPCVGLIEDDVAFIVCDAELASRLRPDDLLHPARRRDATRSLPRREAGGWMLKYPWQIVSRLPDLLHADWRDDDAGVHSELDPHLNLAPRERIHVGERTTIHPTVLIDAASGTVFIGDDVAIGPYAVLEGPLFVGAGTRIHPHSWLHGGNVIGPVCKVAGELHGCVLCGYTNKQHLGYLGHSYVGSWVNLGAGAVNSDLKNTYGSVRVPVNGREVDSGLQFFGSVIADHAKIGIGTAIPTGAVIGMGASVAAGGPCPKFVPSFGWVTAKGLAKGDHLKALDVAASTMARRHVDLTDEEVELFLDLGVRARELESAGGA